MLLFVLGIWQAAIGKTANYLKMFNNSSDFEIGSFGLALFNSLWGYEGRGFVVAVVEELEDMQRNL